MTNRQRPLTPNAQLRRWRKDLWLTQAELAKQVGVSLISVRRWEAGWQPQPEHVRRLCAVLGASPAELGFEHGNDSGASVLSALLEDLPDHLVSEALVLLRALGTATPEQRSAWGLPPALHMAAIGETLGDDMKRREFLHLLGVPPAAVLLSRAGLPQLFGGSAGAPVPNEAALDDLAAAIAAENRLCDQLGCRAVLGLATENARLATDLLRSSPPAALRPRLAVVATEAAVEAGFVYADQHQLPAARSYYQSAAELAQEAGDPGLEAFVLGSWSRRLTEQPYFYAPAAESDNGARALSFVERAQTAAAQRPSSATTMYLATIEAQVQARMGNADASLRALDEADEALTRTEPTEDAPWLTRRSLGVADAGRLHSTRGYCYMRMGRPGDAEAVLAQALSDRDASLPGPRGARLVRLASVRLLQQELEECCSLAGEAVRLVVATGSARRVQQVRDLRLELQPWNGSAAVKDLDDQLAAASWI